LAERIRWIQQRDFARRDRFEQVASVIVAEYAGYHDLGEIPVKRRIERSPVGNQ
jgi:hypothetical protein